MLGRVLVREVRTRGYDLVRVGRSNADIIVDVRDDNTLGDVIRSNSPDVLVNCAAIVDMGLCEQNPLLAWQVNARSVGVMAEACRDADSRFMQVSTDHYFTGGHDWQNDEFAPVTLFNEYARSKYAGESFASICPRYLVLRTNVVGFKGGGSTTFAEWAYNAVKNGEEMTLFKDSFVSSIDVTSFCRSMIDMALLDVCGLFNLSSSEVFSKQRLIEAIAESLNVQLVRAKIGSVRELAVPRAESCGLDVRRAENALGYRLPDLACVVDNLTEEWKRK